MDYIQWIYGKISSYIRYFIYHEENFNITDVKTVHHKVEIMRNESYMTLETRFRWGSLGTNQTYPTSELVEKYRLVPTGLYREFDSYDVIVENGKTFNITYKINPEMVIGRCILRCRTYYVIWKDIRILSSDGGDIGIYT